MNYPILNIAGLDLLLGEAFVRVAAAQGQAEPERLKTFKNWVTQVSVAADHAASSPVVIADWVNAFCSSGALKAGPQVREDDGIKENLTKLVQMTSKDISNLLWEIYQGYGQVDDEEVKEWRRTMLECAMADMDDPELQAYAERQQHKEDFLKKLGMDKPED